MKENKWKIVLNNGHHFYSEKDEKALAILDCNKWAQREGFINTEIRMIEEIQDSDTKLKDIVLKPDFLRTVFSFESNLNAIEGQSYNSKYTEWLEKKTCEIFNKKEDN